MGKIHENGISDHVESLATSMRGEGSTDRRKKRRNSGKKRGKTRLNRGI